MSCCARFGEGKSKAKAKPKAKSGRKGSGRSAANVEEDEEGDEGEDGELEIEDEFDDVDTEALLDTEGELELGDETSGKTTTVDTVARLSSPPCTTNSSSVGATDVAIGRSCIFTVLILVARIYGVSLLVRRGDVLSCLVPYIDL